MLATDLAYYLVRKGVPFRTGHHIAGQVVAEAEKQGINICDLTLEELKCIRYVLQAILSIHQLIQLYVFSSYFDVDVGRVWNYENSIEQYQSIGGTAKESVLHQIDTLLQWLNLNNTEIKEN